MKNYDVLYVGNYTKDTIVSATVTRFMGGGAVNYPAHAAAKLGSKVAVVTSLSKEDDHVVKKFIQAGIDCYRVYSSQSTLMKLDYPTMNPDIRTLSVTAVAAAITAKDVEDIGTKAALIGSSLRGEVGMDVIRALKDKKMLVAADMQGFVRVLRGVELKYEPWEEMQATLASVDEVTENSGQAVMSDLRRRGWVESSDQIQFRNTGDLFFRALMPRTGARSLRAACPSGLGLRPILGFFGASLLGSLSFLFKGRFSALGGDGFSGRAGAKRPDPTSSAGARWAGRGCTGRRARCAPCRAAARPSRPA